jgi:hypothetical protein
MTPTTSKEKTPPPAPAIKPPAAAAKSKIRKAAKLNFELDSKNLRLLLIGGLALAVILFIICAFAGLSIVGGKSRQLVSLKAQSQTADNQLSNLEQSKKQVEKYAYFKTVAKTVIPNDKDQAESVVEIFQMADQSGISIQSITFPASSLGLTTSTTATQQDATKTSTANAITQAKPVSGIPGLYSLELTITPDSSNTVPASKKITYDKMLDFLARIENNRHTAQITQVNIQPGTSGQSFTFTLTVNIFIKPS